MRTKKRKFLVTGGAGFIGSHLCDALVETGYAVVCLDDFSTGSEANIRHLFSCGRFEGIKQDVTAPVSVPVDAIFHLASPASPVHYQQDRVKTLKTNVLGTMHMLELARELKIPLVLASTSEVYGDPAVHPQPEDYRGNVNPTGPRACYDEGKRCAETLCMDYRRQYRTDARIARIFNTYGPRMAAKDGRVIPNFIGQALKDEPLTVYGDGTQTRSFQYIDDLIRGLLSLIEATDIPGPVNLGSPEEYTIGNIARLVIAATGSKSDVEYRPLPEEDPRQRRPDITLAKTRLGWEPRVSFQEGLAKTVDCFQNHL